MTETVAFSPHAWESDYVTLERSREPKAKAAIEGKRKSSRPQR